MIPDKIIIHHSACNDTPALEWGGIRKWHMGTPPNGPVDGPYVDIAYHAGCDLVGDHYEVLYGRQWIQGGAHCPGQNQSSLGFCFVGDFTNAPPPKAQLEAAAKFLREWMRIYTIPVSRVFPHKAFNETECPGNSFDMEALKDLLR